MGKGKRLEEISKERTKGRASRMMAISVWYGNLKHRLFVVEFPSPVQDQLSCAFQLDARNLLHSNRPLGNRICAVTPPKVGGLFILWFETFTCRGILRFDSGELDEYWSSFTKIT
jgi:hypothetical protein